jgi:hypothetical protein
MEDFGGFLAGEVLDHLRQTIARFDNTLKEKIVNGLPYECAIPRRFLEMSVAMARSGFDSELAF